MSSPDLSRRLSGCPVPPPSPPPSAPSPPSLPPAPSPPPPSPAMPPPPPRISSPAITPPSPPVSSRAVPPRPPPMSSPAMPPPPPSPAMTPLSPLMSSHAMPPRPPPMSSPAMPPPTPTTPLSLLPPLPLPSSSWADLPFEILRLFLDRLWFTELARFAAVCTSWWSVASEHPYFQALKLPWLVYKKESSWRMFSPVGDRTLHLHLRNARNNECIGASHGWLIMIDEQGDYLFNPMTYNIIHLPRHDIRVPSKVILSLPPTAGDCVVVAGYFTNDLLVYCRPGSVFWSYFFPIEGLYVSDLIFHNGLLYCVNHFLQVMVFRFAPDPVLICCYNPTMMNQNPGHHPGNLVPPCPYLVDYAGDLLMVLRYLDADNLQLGDRDVCFWNATTCIEVFKLDTHGFRWVPVESLGDWTLFLGIGCSRSVAIASDSKFRRNCIYFTHTCTVYCCTKPHLADWLVFCPEDGSIRQCYMNDRRQSHDRQPVWFMLTA